MTDNTPPRKSVAGKLLCKKLPVSHHSLCRSIKVSKTDILIFHEILHCEGQAKGSANPCGAVLCQRCAWMHKCERRMELLCLRTCDFTMSSISTIFSINSCSHGLNVSSPLLQVHFTLGTGGSPKDHSVG